MIKKLSQLLLLLSLCSCSIIAPAGLTTGNQAPDFTLPGSLAGEDFTFHLQEALKQGPVVVYFYPKAFTSGCTVEAHEFAEASDDFAALGARVVGVSTDDIATLHEFSVEECRNKFAVLADPAGEVVHAYDAKLKGMNIADRISYVIAPTGEILYVHQTMEPKSHIAESLRVIKEWRAAQGQ
ncbi:peroxiredoxin [Halioxenophilus sp. WMMB6]|uniref:peroxiredoxin n=1 Tax=Halioxenophilus sp. WMMB6 TaxID=3073815 RepID=UPI00295F5601|nr:peroxiredoxin [Halioxenophilus sp. WMMB6]